jgi:hypothetical protein
MKRVLSSVGVCLGLLALLIWILDTPLPASSEGADADAAALRLMHAVGTEGWDRTGAVSWRVEGRKHLWDRRRNEAIVEWDDVRVELDLETLKGEAQRGGDAVMDPADVDLLLAKAYSFCARDHFLLYPFGSFFDGGARRGLTTEGGLVITYRSAPPARPEGYEGPIKWWGDPSGWRGGVPQEPLSLGLTPGDSFEWTMGADGLPLRWRMWASILPLGGVEVVWSDWQTLSTGAKVAMVREGFREDIRFEGLKAAETLEELAP